jgi:MPBQ/MSBQ methyltransferase
MVLESKSAGVADEDQPELRQYLHSQYDGVFSDAQIEIHIRDYVGNGFANVILPYVVNQVPRSGKVLDVGTGFGSFVLACRQAGLDAIGIDLAEFEILYARRCLQRERPQEDPLSVFRLADGLDLPFETNSFDAVTLWNVLEHVSDICRLLKEAVRVLKPGGILYIICPNYAAFRDEAHYHIFWPSLIPRNIAITYLRVSGKNPRFFQTSIFYRTNWEVHFALIRLGMRIARIDGLPPFDSKKVDLFVQTAKTRILQPGLIRNTKIKPLFYLLKRIHLNWIPIIGVNFIATLQHFILTWERTIHSIDLYNPFIQSVILSAKKDAR